MRRLRSLALVLLLASSAQVEAGTLINVDLSNATLSVDLFTGAAVFGTATSSWNELSRGSGQSNTPLLDDTGSSTSVTVSYTRSGSGVGVATGTFGNLGRSTISSGAVTLSGLTPNGRYDLAIFSSWSGAPSFQVGAQTLGITPTSDWSTLTAGSQYVLFQGVSASASGDLVFTPLANPSSTTSQSTSPWSAFQLQEAVTSVPEPSTVASLGLGLFALVGFARRKAASSR